MPNTSSVRANSNIPSLLVTLRSALLIFAIAAKNAE
jgi:hypothetical protein